MLNNPCSCPSVCNVHVRCPVTNIQAARCTQHTSDQTTLIRPPQASSQTPLSACLHQDELPIIANTPSSCEHPCLLLLKSISMYTPSLSNHTPTHAIMTVQATPSKSRIQTSLPNTRPQTKHIAPTTKPGTLKAQQNIDLPVRPFSATFCHFLPYPPKPPYQVFHISHTSNLNHRHLSTNPT